MLKDFHEVWTPKSSNLSFYKPLSTSVLNLFLGCLKIIYTPGKRYFCASFESSPVHEKYDKLKNMSMANTCFWVGVGAKNGSTPSQGGLSVREREGENRERETDTNWKVLSRQAQHDLDQLNKPRARSMSRLVSETESRIGVRI